MKQIGIFKQVISCHRPALWFGVLVLAFMILDVKSSFAQELDTAPFTVLDLSASGNREPPDAVTASQLNRASAAPDYCASSGGSSQYENITNAVLTPNNDGTMKLQVNIFIANPKGCVAGQECPSYDPSPEHVNAWIDWNGDKVWDASEQVMDKDLTGYLAINYAGTMTGIAQFAIPATFTETTWLRANLGWSHDPNDPCETAWSWGNVVDQQVLLKAPKIKEIKAAGSKDVKNPMTTYDVKLEAVLETPTDFEVTKVSWSGDLKPGDGNPYTYKPDKGTQGKKKIKATVSYKNKTSGTIGQVSKEYEFKLFFEKKGDDNGDGKPNWFDYWGVDGAVPNLVDPKVIYDATKGPNSYGAWSPASDKVELGGAAAETHYPGGLVIDGTTYGNVKGIDSLSEVIGHELRHRTTIKVNWGAGGIWVGKTDSDFHKPTNAYYDNLPDEYEITFGTDKTKTDTKDLEHKKSAVYKYYGDNEFDAIVAGHGKKGVVDKDWANPGKQSDPSFVSAASMESTQASEASGLVTASSQYQTPAVVIPDLAQLSGSYTDAGVDANSDGQFELLRLTVGVNVTTPGAYELVGWLQSAAGVNLAWAYTNVVLEGGAQQVPLNFDGKLLRLQGENGPYKLAHIELRTGDESDVVDFADNAHTTSAYTVNTFTSPAVTYTGAYTDSGADTNSNGLLDTLTIHVGVAVNQAGDYTLVGWLYDADGNAIPGAVASSAFTTSGTQPLVFDGKSIRWQRKNGPYTVRYLEVRDSNQGRVAFLTQAYTTTTAYAAGQFEAGGAAEINAAAYTDEGVDLNSDGLYDFLRVNMLLNATTAGDYQIAATLKDKDGQSIIDVAKAVSLTVGSNAVTLDFPGGNIRKHGVDGPYQVAQVALASLDGTVVDQQAVAASTQPYTSTAFAFPLILLASDFRDQAVDVDNDGKLDYLNIAVNLQPGNNGVVIAQGRLVDKNDQEIQWVESNIPVTAGVVQTITLPFSATQILSHGVDGPYVLKNVLIYHTGDPAQGITDLAPYLTAGYRHSDLTLFIGPPATIDMTVAPNKLIADGNSISNVAATVKDANGKLVPGQLVNFTTSLGTITPSSQKTDINGVVNASLQAPLTVGNATVTASAGNINKTSTVELIAGPPTSLSAIVSPTLISADGKSIATIRVTVKDAFGNPVAGQVVNFVTSLGTIVGSAQTDANGIAIAPLTAATTKGVAQVTVSIGGLQTSVKVTIGQVEQKMYLPLVKR